MSPDHEHETRDKTSNVSANNRHVSPERMRQFEGYVTEILTAFGWIRTRRPRVTPRDAFSRPCSTAPTDTREIRN